MRSMGSPTAIVKAAVVVSLLAVAAIAFVPLATDTAGNQSLFGTHATSQMAAVDGINATVETTIRHGNETSRSVERVSLRPKTGERRARLLPGSGKHWDLRVSNGSVLWLYDQDDNEADPIPLTSSAGGTTTQTERLRQLFERLNRSRTTDTDEPTPTPGIQPLPAVPQSGTSHSAVAAPTGSGSIDVTYVRNDTVDGRSTYLLRLQTQSTSESAMVQNYTQRLWVDTEYYYPLKRQTSWRQDGERTEITTTYRNVTFNPGLEDSLFFFEPPANATVSEADEPNQWTYGSTTALRVAATISVPNPAVPDSFRLTVATRTVEPGRVRSVGLRYVNATGKVTISKSNLTWYQPRTESQTVSIGNREAEFRNLGPEQTVSWTCREWRYSVTGRGVSKSVLLDVATSVSCD